MTRDAVSNRDKVVGIFGRTTASQRLDPHFNAHRTVVFDDLYSDGCKSVSNFGSVLVGSF